ncbi:hypothetical protein TNCT_233471 [Trichonephila clavata]|uniref:Uncharacterized protein n=1 Tax=Trichonephila clavata TaxID=2740835 RepID=A0A8X6F8V5_TRICU|nr:hypothetical protein TNCT_233471 [Trichonephila clavata]
MTGRAAESLSKSSLSYRRQVKSEKMWKQLTDGRQVLPGRSSPYQLRSKRHSNERQELARRSSPYTLRMSVRQAAT